jgi:aerobic C4-dicarboxylate transport protein
MPAKPSKLYLVVLLGIGAGVVLGWATPETAVGFKPLGDLFVRCIKLLIGPLIFSTVASGIAGLGDLKKVGRVGVKALLWFELMTTVALVLGLLVVEVVGPGRGMHVVAEQLDVRELEKTVAAPRGVVDHLLAVVPDTFVGAFVSGDALQLLFLAVLSGLALASLGSKGKWLRFGLEQVAGWCFAVVRLVMYAAPVGAFGAMAFTIGKYGLGALANLGQLLATFYVSASLFVLVVLGGVLRLMGFSILRLLGYMQDELLLVLGTSSSESALPQLMNKLEALGCAPGVVRLVVPTGYSFNLDGTCLYLTMASVFVAQALDVPLTLGEQLKLLAVLLLTSKGAAGVTGSGFVTLAATLRTTGTVPVAGLSLLLGIDRFMSEARALTNLVGNAVATLVVSKWERALDVEKAGEVLSAKR